MVVSNVAVVCFVSHESTYRRTQIGTRIDTSIVLMYVMVMLQKAAVTLYTAMNLKSIGCISQCVGSRKL